MFILASASPRRRELLQQIDASFEVKVASVEEVTGGNLAPAEIVVENAVRKAKAVAEAFPGYAVLGADTIVFLDGRVYGKPKDGEEAKAMLRALAGREHEVATGIAWVHAGEVFTDVETTRVFFAPLTEEAIDAYVKTGERSTRRVPMPSRAGRRSSSSRLRARSPTSWGFPSTQSAGLPERQA